MALCAETDQKQRSITVSFQTKLSGSPPGCCLSDLNTSRGPFPEPPRTPARDRSRAGVRILCFLSSCSGLHPEATQAAAGNSPDIQAKSVQSAHGVVSSKASSISRDRRGCRTGARHRSSSSGWGRQQPCLQVCWCICVFMNTLYMWKHAERRQGSGTCQLGTALSPHRNPRHSLKHCI